MKGKTSISIPDNGVGGVNNAGNEWAGKISAALWPERVTQSLPDVLAFLRAKGYKGVALTGGKLVAMKQACADRPSITADQTSDVCFEPESPSASRSRVSIPIKNSAAANAIEPVVATPRRVALRPDEIHGIIDTAMDAIKADLAPDAGKMATRINLRTGKVTRVMIPQASFGQWASVKRFAGAGDNVPAVVINYTLTAATAAGVKFI